MCRLCFNKPSCNHHHDLISTTAKVPLCFFVVNLMYPQPQANTGPFLSLQFSCFQNVIQLEVYSTSPPHQVLLLSLGTRDQRFAHMAASLSPSPSLLSELCSFTVYASLSSHQLVDIRVVSTFWQLGSNLFKHLCTGLLYAHIILIFPGQITQETAGLYGGTINLAKKCHTAFQHTYIILYSHEGFSCESPRCCAGQYLVLSGLQNFSHLGRCVTLFCGGFNLHFSNDQQC